MEINISEIVTAKLEQMKHDRIIEKKIEEILEKSIMDAITSELSGYSFKHAISKQISDGIGEIAEKCGLSAYNGFIAEQVKKIVQDMYASDIAQKVQAELDDVILKRHENVKLSDIFQAYRKWVLENTEESEKYERKKFTHQLDVEVDGCFTHYTCTFADRPLDIYGYHKRGDIELRLCTYEDKDKTTISSIHLAGHDISKSLRIGKLSCFEAFVVNLFYNKTDIIMDEDDVEEDPYFDIDC